MCVSISSYSSSRQTTVDWSVVGQFLTPVKLPLYLCAVLSLLVTVVGIHGIVFTFQKLFSMVEGFLGFNRELPHWIYSDCSLTLWTTGYDVPLKISQEPLLYLFPFWSQYISSILFTSLLLQTCIPFFLPWIMKVKCFCPYNESGRKLSSSKINKKIYIFVFSFCILVFWSHSVSLCDEQSEI